MDTLSRAYILQALGRLGLDLSSPQSQGQCFTLADLAERLGVVERHRRLLGRFLEILAEEGDLRRHGDGWEVVQPAACADPLPIWKQAVADQPASHPDLTLLHRCGQALAQALRGEQDPLELIFPEGSLTTTEHLYQDSPFNRFSNLAARDAVREALARLPEGRTVRVLEIGAGTGGLTAHVLPVLPVGRTEYVFTDLSNHFFTKAEKKFSDYPFVKYQRLDIETSPLDQGYAGHSFDLVLASQVLHATADLRRTLGNVRRLLAADGMLVLVESVVRFRWIDVVFGLLEGWWRVTDRDLRPDYPLLDFPRWQEVLGEIGFTDVRDASCRAEGQGLGKAVILGRSPLGASPAETQPENRCSPLPSGGEGLGVRGPCEQADGRALPAGTGTGTGRWLLFADRGGIATELAQRLREHGEPCSLVFTGTAYQQLADDRFEIAPADREQMRRVLDAVFEPGHASCRGVIHCWNLDQNGTGPADEPTAEALEGAQAASCLSVIHLMQTWGPALSPATDGQVPRLSLVTSRAQPVGPEPLAMGQTPVWGLARVLANEFPHVRCQRIDLGLTDLGAARAAELAALVEEVRRRIRRTRSPCAVTLGMFTATCIRRSIPQARSRRGVSLPPVSNASVSPSGSKSPGSALWTAWRRAPVRAWHRRRV